MIGRLIGTLAEVEGNVAIIDVNGVGYEVHASQRDIRRWEQSPSQVRAYIQTDVREDAITLFAFASTEDRAAFLALRAVGGIGPSTALAALDALGLAELARAVAQDDLVTLTAIPKVGKKLAARLALELKGKLPHAEMAPPQPSRPAKSDDLFEATLAKLGYLRTEIDRARAALDADGVSDDSPIEDRVRAALRVLSSK